MSKHLFGLVVTAHGTAANNRGETEGNITTLQKILWNGEVHTTVSAEAIRWAIRYFWQSRGLPVNRRWEDESRGHTWSDRTFTSKGADFIDDDLLGFMSAEAARQEANPAERTQRTRARGTVRVRRARLEVSRAISLTPWPGDLTFNAASPGATPAASRTGGDPVPYGTEVHACRYQYGFALTPEDLYVPDRALDAVDAVVQLSQVAGNHARFLYDFSPDAVVFRWTEDFAPRILYGFEIDPQGELRIPQILRRVEAGDIRPNELVIGGAIAAGEESARLREGGVAVFEGVVAAAEEVKSRVRQDLFLGGGAR